ncbi:hypothetical protein EH206_17895 [Brenneria nigrifluens DSM 30175 = ATCC 13028]|uniref:Toxin CcdB n=1 Tax=Brenneria nigrifluens DSM 30175 = ATCC 13028 TaxID=1121120 RepID=A0A2U1UEW7_9GAMM|nr:hypothetical protein DDT54_21460 [Brenneria nigrifluens DSM 30175 = ATCC 13028]QCR07008.1 hypothetical protein EH206_17895 [Brenneria nigrifluens DSM 30175 = ATCC 13028]
MKVRISQPDPPRCQGLQERSRAAGTDGKEYAVMTHELASIPVRSLGAMFCDASQYRIQIKAAIDFLIDGI